VMLLESLPQTFVGLRNGVSLALVIIVVAEMFIGSTDGLGQRVFDSIGKAAWAEWLAHQTMLINENRLSPLDPKHRAMLEAEMEKFLFGGGADKPAGFVAPDA